MTRMNQALAGAIAVLAGALMPLGAISRASAEPIPAAGAKPVSAFERLRGRWLRDSGGYVIEIRSVGAGGKLEAAYFNPGSIHVGRYFQAVTGETFDVYFMRLKS
jgi:hypothetical protein